MQTFVPSRNVYEKLLHQHGGTIDRYVFGTQHGDGLGSFFGKLFRFARPLVSSAIKGIKPELLSIGQKAIDHGSKTLISHIQKGQEKATQQIKRKRDNLDVDVPK